MHFGLAEDSGQFVLSWWANDRQGGPIALQGMLKEELDATECNGERAARELAFSAEIEEILAQIGFSKLLGGFLSYGSNAIIVACSVLSISTRSHRRVLAGIALFNILGLSVFVVYFQHRKAIRHPL